MILAGYPGIRHRGVDGLVIVVIKIGLRGDERKQYQPRHPRHPRVGGDL